MSFSQDDSGDYFKQLLAKNEQTFQLKYDYKTFDNSCGSTCGTSTCNAVRTVTSYVAEVFGVTSLLMEASFKQLKNKPTNESWTHESCVKLGYGIANSLNEFFLNQGGKQRH